jgi:tRNA (cytidine/uridine-2'-O-)-methyltransferase
MFDIVLYEPEIAPNTGNVIRLAANSGARLHLVRPLGYTLNDRTLARAGLDYHEHASMQVHDDWNACVEALGPRRLFAVTTRGATRYDTVHYAENDVLVFGPETRGLPESVLNTFPADQQLRLPMLEHSRSLNLANAVAIVVYEAWRQSGFTNGG